MTSRRSPAPTPWRPDSSNAPRSSTTWDWPMSWSGRWRRTPKAAATARRRPLPAGSRTGYQSDGDGTCQWLGKGAGDGGQLRGEAVWLGPRPHGVGLPAGQRLPAGALGLVALPRSAGGLVGRELRLLERQFRLGDRGGQLRLVDRLHPHQVVVAEVGERGRRLAHLPGQQRRRLGFGVGVHQVGGGNGLRRGVVRRGSGGRRRHRFGPWAAPDVPPSPGRNGV